MQMKRFDTINVIPLIDVMLVLLAIVLTTASFIVKDNLNIELPETENTSEYVPPPKKVPLQLHINGENIIFMDEVEKTLDEVELALSEIKKDRHIILQIDKEAKFDGFVQLVDLLKKHQLNNLNILTKSQK